MNLDVVLDFDNGLMRLQCVVSNLLQMMLVILKFLQVFFSGKDISATTSTSTSVDVYALLGFYFCLRSITLGLQVKTKSDPSSGYG